MEDAARIAYRELVHWLVADYGWDKYEAYFFLTHPGRPNSPRQYGRPKIHAGSFYSEELSQLDWGFLGVWSLTSGIVW
jgi:hypothetical protein